MPPGASPTPTSPPPPPLPPKPGKPQHSRDWSRVRNRARVFASVSGLFIFLIAIGSVGGYFYSASKKNSPATKPTVTSLSPEELAKLTEVGTNLGSSGQTLNIGANALFRGQVDITGALTVGGAFSANGPVTLSQLNITGTTALAGLNVNSNLTVGGATNLQQTLNVAGLATFSSGINAGGSSSVNALNAASISVQTINISGPLSIRHLATQGPAPIFVTGTAVGAGGTGNLSGNDTAGTVNFSTGSGPAAGVLGTVTFRSAFTSTPHVLISPLTGAAGASNVYVTRTSGGFQLRTDTPLPAGAVVNFDYFVTQ